MATENKQLYQAFDFVLWFIINTMGCYTYVQFFYTGFVSYFLFIISVALINVLIRRHIQPYFYE